MPPALLPPYQSLHERISDFASADLEKALYERRELMRLKAMRGTVFVWSRRLASLAFAATRAATLAADRRWLAANDRTYARLASRVLAVLAGRSLTVAELRRTLGDDPELSGVVAMLCDEGAPCGIDPSAAAAAASSGTGCGRRLSRRGA
jgi:winged helix DNA-binding protein